MIHGFFTEGTSFLNVSPVIGKAPNQKVHAVTKLHVITSLLIAEASRFAQHKLRYQKEQKEKPSAMRQMGSVQHSFVFRGQVLEPYVGLQSM